MAEITLPRASDARPGRGRSLRHVPTAFDVPTVSPPHDPGVNVPLNAPSGAFGGGEINVALGEVGQDVFNYGLFLRREAEKQQRRHDATKTSESLLAFEDEANKDSLRWETEDDPARLGFMPDVETRLEALRDQYLEDLDEDVSEEAKADLRVRMQRVLQAQTRQAGLLSLAAGSKKADDAIGKIVNQLGAQAASDPDRIFDLLEELDARLDPFAGALNADQERDNRRAGRQTIILGTVEGYVKAGRFEEARVLTEVAAGDGELTPEQRVRAERMILSGERDAINAAEKAEAADEKELKEAQEFRAAILTDGIFEGTTTDGDLDAALANREIDPGQFISLRKLLKSQESEDALEDDPKVVLQFTVLREQNILTAPEVIGAFADKLITRPTMDRFLKEIKDDPYDHRTKNEIKTLRENMTGILAVGASLGSEETQMINDTVEMLKLRVDGGEDARAVRLELEERALGPRDVESFLPPRFRVGESNQTMDIQATRRATAKAFLDGKITTARELKRELELIERIKRAGGGLQ
jgi:hypothetical protein